MDDYFERRNKRRESLAAARRQTRKWIYLGVGAGVVVGLDLADGTSQSELLIASLLGSVYFILHRGRRRTVESSPYVKPPFVLPAVSHPGSFARLPQPRPAFGLRLRYRPVRGAVVLGVIFGIPLAVVAATDGAAAALFSLLAIVVWSLTSFLWWTPLEIRVTRTSIVWKAGLRRHVIPLARLRRLRCDTMPSTAIVLEFEGHRQRVMLVTGGFADFLEALTVTCPWVEVSSEIVERFGSWSGKKDGFFVESLNPAARGG